MQCQRGHAGLLGPCAVVVVLCAGGAGAHGAGSPPAWEVRGEALQDDPAVQDCAAAALREAWRRAPAELGVEPGVVPVRWILDASPCGNAPGGEGSDPPGTLEAARTDFGGGGIRVTLRSQLFLSRPEEAAVVVRHETAHAVLASAAGTEQSYRKIPQWFREGIALWFAREGDLRLDDTIAYSVFRGGTAASFLRGIASVDLPAGRTSPSPPARPGGPVSHAEAYLAVSWIESRVGAQGLRRLCRAAARGRSVERELAALLGKPLAAVAALAYRDACRRVRRRLPVEREEAFRKSLELRRLGRWAAAEAAWNRLLSGRPRDGRPAPLEGTLHYLLAVSLAARPAARRPSGALRRHIDAVLRSPSTLWRARVEALRRNSKVSI